MFPYAGEVVSQYNRKNLKLQIHRESCEKTNTIVGGFVKFKAISAGELFPKTQIPRYAWKIVKFQSFRGIRNIVKIESLAKG